MGCHEFFVTIQRHLCEAIGLGRGAFSPYCHNRGLKFLLSMLSVAPLKTVVVFLCTRICHVKSEILVGRHRRIHLWLGVYGRRHHRRWRNFSLSHLRQMG